MARQVPLVGKAALGLGKPKLVAHQVHQVGRVFAVVNGEGWIKADAFSVFPQEAGADAVEGASPGQRIGHHAGLIAENAARDALDALGHFGGGSP
jgi:hypothetical protein